MNRHRMHPASGSEGHRRDQPLLYLAELAVLALSMLKRQSGCSKRMISCIVCYDALPRGRAVQEVLLVLGSVVLVVSRLRLQLEGSKSRIHCAGGCNALPKEGAVVESLLASGGYAQGCVIAVSPG